MDVNEGTIDRVIRVILGIALIVVGFAVIGGTGGIILGIIGFVPLLTGLAGRCPLYKVLGVCTLKQS